MKEDNLIFLAASLLILLGGLATSETANHALYKPTEFPNPSFEPTEHVQLSPESEPVDGKPILMAFIILFIIVFIKENGITWRPVKNHIRTRRENIILKFKHWVRDVRKALNNHPTIDLTKMRRKALKNAKKSSAWFSKEWKKTKEFFTKPYDVSDTEKYALMAMVVGIVGMALYAAIPGVNPGLYTDGLIEIFPTPQTPAYVQESFAPAIPINGLPIVLALGIITIAVIVKERRTYNE